MPRLYSFLPLTLWFIFMWKELIYLLYAKYRVKLNPNFTTSFGIRRHWRTRQSFTRELMHETPKLAYYGLFGIIVCLMQCKHFHQITPESNKRLTSSWETWRMEMELVSMKDVSVLFSCALNGAILIDWNKRAEVWKRMK